jgi:hypothetical protein
MDIIRRHQRYYYSVTSLNTADISASNMKMYSTHYYAAVRFMFLIVVTTKTSDFWEMIHNTRAQ